MGEEFIVDGAPCMCKFGTTPGMLKVSDHSVAYLNTEKPVATTMTLGNTFYPPGFTVCKFIPTAPKPCTASVVKWSNSYDKLEIGMGAYALTDKSKGTCAIGCPDCISINMTGQLGMPGAGQMENATSALQNEIDPLGEGIALTGSQIDSLLDIK